MYERDYDAVITLNSNAFNLELNQPAYLSIVYIRYNSEMADQKMTENSYDKFELYFNGVLFDYCYCDSNGYNEGLEVWNTLENFFYVGVCCYGSSNNNCYLNGDIYSTRLYSKTLTLDQIKLNYDMTLKYRDSFKDE